MSVDETAGLPAAAPDYLVRMSQACYRTALAAAACAFLPWSAPPRPGELVVADVRAGVVLLAFALVLASGALTNPARSAGPRLARAIGVVIIAAGGCAAAVHEMAARRPDELPGPAGAVVVALFGGCGLLAMLMGVELARRLRGSTGRPSDLADARRRLDSLLTPYGAWW